MKPVVAKTVRTGDHVPTGVVFKLPGEKQMYVKRPHTTYRSAGVCDGCIAQFMPKLCFKLPSCSLGIFVKVKEAEK